MSHDNLYEIVNNRTGEIIATRGKLATSATSRAVGLLGKKGLDPAEALIIRPCWSIHTWFMRFRIDVLFLGKDGLVRKLVRRMPTYHFAASLGARDVIELAPGVLENLDVKIGDPIEIRSVGACS